MLFKAMVPVGGLQPLRRLGFGPRRIYLVGGDGGAGQGKLCTVLAYDPALDSWCEVASMATERCAHGAAALGGKLYVMSGFDGEVVSAEAEVYDPKADSWQPLPSMPTARVALAVAAVAGKIYAIGGRDGDGDLCDAVEAFDPVSGAWARVASLPVARSSHTATLFAGKIYVLGGDQVVVDPEWAEGSRVTRCVDMYDFATDSWQQMAAMPKAKFAHTAAMLGGKIYVTGGYDADGVSTDCCGAYDPVTNTWTTLATLSEPRCNHASAVFNGKLYVFGGWSMHREQLNVVEVYSPASNSWASVADLPLAIDEAVAVAI